MNKQMNEDNIRVAAYYIWEQAGRPEGADKDCWIKAVEQLFAAKPACKKSACKSSAKVAAKPAAKKAPAKAKPAAKSSVKSAASATPFYGAKKK